MRRSLRKSGIDVIGDVPWGEHFCQFYQTQKDLMDILIPYFKAGLENNELCIWVSPESCKAKEKAVEDLKKNIPIFETYLEKGQIEIIPSSDLHINEGIFDSQKSLGYWIRKVNQALNNGYNGLRLSLDFSWLKENWNNLCDYEEKLGAVIENHRIKALCTYSLNQFDITNIIDASMHHQFSLVKREGKWEHIENPGLKRAEEKANQIVKEVDTKSKEVQDNFEKLPEEKEIQLEKAHRSLKESEERFAKTQKMAHIGNWEWDISTGKLHWSDEVYRIFGYKPQEFGATYDLFLSYVHPEDREYVIEAIKKGFNGDLQCIDYRIILPDGEERSVHTQSEIFFDAENIPVRAEGIIQDVTERKRAEEALRKNETQLQVIIANSPDIIFEQNLDLRYTWAFNPTPQLSISDLLGKTDADILPLDQAQLLTSIKRRVLDTGAREKAIIQLSPPGNEIRWYEAIFEPHYDEVGKIVGILSYTRDITERKKTEDALQESEVKYRNMIETASEGVLTSDSEFRVIYVNKKMEEMFGYSQEEMIGKSELDFINEESKAISSLIRENIRQGINEPIEIKLKCKNGSFFWALVNYKPNFDKDGKFIGSLVMLTDITKHKQEESRISRYNRVLEGINCIFSNVVQAKTEEELGNTCLSVALEVTGSEFGFINEICEDGLLHDVAKSKLGWEQCLMYDKTGHPSSQSSFVVHGLYGSVIKNEKSFYTNNPPAHPDSIGLPNGHPPLRSFLGVPLVQDGETLGLIAVANREGGYSFEQQEDLEAIVPAVIQALQRKRSEEALRFSNVYNRSLIEVNLDPLVTIGSDGKVTDVNAATEQVTGYPRNELIGTDFSDYFTEPEKARTSYQQVFMLGEIRDYPLEIQHKDGHITPVLYNASVYKDEDGEVIGVFAAARDITELKKAEEKISILANAVESSEDAIITKSLEGIVTSWNRGAEKIYGYLAEEVLGKNISILEPADLKGEIKRFSEMIEQGEKLKHYETLRLKKDGTKINVSVTLSPVFNASGELIAISTIARDITERKQTEQHLIRQAFMLANINDAVIGTDADYRINYWSPPAEKMYGYRFEEIIGQHSRILKPEFFGMTSKEALERLENTGMLRVELIHTTKDGRRIIVDSSNQLLYDHEGKHIGMIGINRDITDRKKAEEALRTLNNYNRSLIEASLDPLVTIGSDGKITDVNFATEQVTGYSRNDLIGTDFSDYFTESEKAKEGYKQVFLDGEVRDYPLEIQHKDGKITPVLYNASVYKDEHGEVIGIFAAARDITELKKVLETLHRSEDQFRALVQNVKSGIALIDEAGKFAVVNPTFMQMFGLSDELDILNVNSQKWSRWEVYGEDGKLLHVDDHPAQKAVRTGKPVKDQLVSVRNPGENELTWMLISAEPILKEDGHIYRTICTFYDITELKQAEEALQESEGRFRALLTASSEVIYRVSPDWSEMRHLYGRGFLADTEIPSSSWLQEYVPPEDQPRITTAINEAIRKKNTYQLEHRVRLADGSLGWIFSRAVPILDKNGEIIEWFGAASDITERKKAEELLRESEERYRTLFSTMDEGFCIIEVLFDEKEKPIDYIFVEANPAFEKQTGFKNTIGKRISELIPGNEQYWCEIYGKIALTGESSRFENYVEDLHKWYDVYAYRVGDLKSQRVAILFNDVTQRKQAEEVLKKAHESLEEKVKERTAELEKAYKSLKESETGLAEAQKLAHVGNWDWNVETSEGYWSDELYRIFGRSLQEPSPSYDELLNYIHPDDRDYVDKSIKKGLNEGPKDGIDYRIILDNGEERIVHSRAEVTFNEKNIPIRVKGIVQDITKQRRAEEKTKILADAVESSNDAIITLSFDCIITSWNKGAEQIYGYSAQEILGKNVSIIEPNNLKGEIKSFCEKIRHGEQVQHYESIRLKKDGALVNISAALSPVFNASGELVAVLAISRDITERVEAEKTLAKIDKLRIKEIHHRIKNNLQVITSLLDLQAEKFQDQEVLEAFKESQNRVISMALIHEELYKGEGMDTLNFSAYLQKLVETLFYTYSLKSKDINLVMDLEKSACFNMDTAVPLGIVVNELVSNSLKHAFNENEKGEIRIQLYREAKGNQTDVFTFNLTISDNGKGIPENIRLETFESLGLKLVHILIDQLDGKIEINRTNGTEFRIIFKVAGAGK